MKFIDELIIELCSQVSFVYIPLEFIRDDLFAVYIINYGLKFILRGLNLHHITHYKITKT